MEDELKKYIKKLEKKNHKWLKKRVGATPPYEDAKIVERHQIIKKLKEILKEA